MAAAAGMRSDLGVPVDPVDQDIYAQLVAELRDALGAAAFAALWEAGRVRPLAAAIGEALADGDQPIGPPAVAPAAFGLTPRELEVVRLVAEGLTDREIAARLFLSPRTVQRHVAGVLDALNLHSRSAAAAYAARHGLADED
jgi:DNA-binding NarL/FixJ family response regulator